MASSPTSSKIDLHTSMDRIFLLGDSDRANWAHLLFHSLGCSYLCLWFHLPQNYLQCEYGYYPEELREQQPSTSFGSLARGLFDKYCMQSFLVDQKDVVPGLAFKRRSPCIVLRELELQQVASADVQRQFYQESRTKTAVFIGCRSGEIELGFSIFPQMNLEMEMRKLFAEAFPSMDLPLLQIPASIQDLQQQSRPSSSSSRSLDSPEYPSFPFNLSAMREPPFIINQPNTTTITPSPIHPQANTFTQQGFPPMESIDAVIANALLAAITSPVSPSAASSRPPRANQGGRTLAPPDRFGRRSELSAFRSCSRAIAPRNEQAFQASSPRFRRQTMMKKVLSFYRGLNITRLQPHLGARDLGAGLSRPTSTQLHHVISERKRREKINESFQALRSLLPPGTKRDKATVLRTTKDYMSTLKDQISELNRRNQHLETQISSLGDKGDKCDPDTISSGWSSPNANERVRVQLTPVMQSSSSEERRMDLRVSVQGEGSSMIDLVMRLIGFLKEVREVRLASMEAQTVMESSSREQQQQQNPINLVTMRLVIEGNEWDQAAFLEAVRRII